MRKILFILFAFCSLIGSSQITEQDFLSANGQVLCNAKGDTVVLRGTNLGAWLSFENWMGPSGYGAIGRSNWTVTAQYTQVGSSAVNMIDGDLNTTWNSGRSQYSNNQWVIIDMGQTEICNRVEFKTTPNTSEFPRAFELYQSADGSQWSLLGSFTSDNGDVKAYTDIAVCRYIKIVQTEKVIENWSVSELNVSMNDDIHVRRSLINRFGEEDADALIDYYCSIWITETDLDQIKSMGMNVVRVPFFWMEIMREDGTIKPNAFRHLDWLVEQCTERGIYVILDLHCSPGGNDGYFTSGMAVSNDLWSSSYYQELTVKIWEEVAKHYVSNPAIACYDVLNESWSNSDLMTVDQFYDVLYSAIRAVDTDHTICVQAFPNFDYVTSPSNHGWSNVMYQAHYYNTDYHNYASQDGFAEAAISDMLWHQQNWNVPVIAGEFAFWEHTDVWKKFLRGLNSANISWTNWSYKCKESVSSRDNFSFYTDNFNADPDLIYDDIATIKAKWDKFGSEWFVKNNTLIDLVKTAISTQPQVPLEKQVYIQQYDEQYLVLLDNAQMSFSSYDKVSANTFTIKKVDNNQVVILGSNNKYLSTEGGGEPMTCSRDSYDGWERFTWIDLGNNEFGLFGHSGFVSGQGGNEASLICDRTALSGWERFLWTEESSNAIPTDNKPQGIVFFDRTLKNTEGIPKDVSIYSYMGQLVSELKLDGNASTTLNLSKGCYILSIKHGDFIDNKKVLLQ